jgi:hypothetical protein
MRGAYYCAGWPYIKDDMLRHMRFDCTFFGSPIPTGVHPAMADVLNSVEKALAASKPDLSNWLRAGKFKIGCFVPRWVRGSSVLSNHAFGLAIDIDDGWNPMIKKALHKVDVISAFQRATGERLDVSFVAEPLASGFVGKVYERMAQVSKRLVDWLNRMLPIYEQLQSDMEKAKKDARQKDEYQKLSKKWKDDKDIQALDTLIKAYTRKKIDIWRVYGILSIPREVIEAFLSLGQTSGAQWGGRYKESKDNMHLELDPEIVGRASKARRTGRVSGLDDLNSPRTQPTPVNGPSP